MLVNAVLAKNTDVQLSSRRFLISPKITTKPETIPSKLRTTCRTVYVAVLIPKIMGCPFQGLRRQMVSFGVLRFLAGETARSIVRRLVPAEIQAEVLALALNYSQSAKETTIPAASWLQRQWILPIRERESNHMVYDNSEEADPQVGEMPKPTLVLHVVQGRVEKFSQLRKKLN